MIMPIFIHQTCAVAAIQLCTKDTATGSNHIGVHIIIEGVEVETSPSSGQDDMSPSPCVEDETSSSPGQDDMSPPSCPIPSMEGMIHVHVCLFYGKCSPVAGVTFQKKAGARKKEEKERADGPASNT